METRGGIGFKVHFDRYLNRNEVDVIRAARRTVVEYNNEYWTRRDRPEEMDITIGAKDSAEITDLVGIYLLWKLGDEFPDIGGGLYRDDVLLIVSKYSKVKIQRSIKRIRTFFGREGLKITVEVKNLVKNISIRISTLSANEAIFLNFAPRYNDALARSGLKETIYYITPTTRSRQTRNRKRNVTWLNPPI